MSISSEKAREQAFILIFEKSFNGDMSIEDIINMAYESGVLSQSKKCEELAKITCEQFEDIDLYIEKYLHNWSINRISKVSLAVLRLCISEILNFPKTPVNVAISEAINICKTYGADDDYSFVNGILSSFAKDRAQNNDNTGD